MAKPPVLGHGLDGVTGGVPEVQRAPEVAFPFIGGHHRGLDSARVDNDGNQDGRISLKDGGRLAPDAIEQIGACDHSILYDFVQTGAELPSGEGLQPLRVDHDRSRGVEGTDQVLAERVIDAHLAPDGAIDLREQGGGYLYERHAPQERGRGKADEVADDAAAKGEDRRGAIGLCSNERFVDAGHGLQGLEPFTIRDEDRLSLRQGVGHRPAVQLPDERTRDHEHACPRAGRVEERAETRGESVAHRHGVRSRSGTDGDVNRLHASDLRTCDAEGSMVG